MMQKAIMTFDSFTNKYFPDEAQLHINEQNYRLKALKVFIANW